MKTKYIFVTGGVVSGLGKGITASSLGHLLKARNKKVTIQKIDPYLNVDPGALSPMQHGEVFVTEDGAETDQDLGHYERFIDENLSEKSNITTGQIYQAVINKERNGDYGRVTVQVIPHITNEIKSRIYSACKNNDAEIVITEIGGIVGDIESTPFLEAIRQVALEIGKENVLYIHVTLVPYIPQSGEMKTKPTQHSVKELLMVGIQPDVIVCRTEREMTEEMKEKIALFCNVAKDSIIQNRDAETLYELPLMLEKEGLADIAVKKLNLMTGPPDLGEWGLIKQKLASLNKTISIGMVVLYPKMHDAYISLVEALEHAGISKGFKVKIKWLDVAKLTKENMKEELTGLAGIIVSDTVNESLLDAHLEVVQYARENNFPFLGINLGLLALASEFVKNVLDDEQAAFKDLEEGDWSHKHKRLILGAQDIKVKKESKLFDIYKEENISERFRQKHEINSALLAQAAAQGLIISAVHGNNIISALEVQGLTFFMGLAFSPEFKSRPIRPSLLFESFLEHIEGFAK